MTNQITKEDYDQEVHDLAISCVDEARKWDRDISDVVHETIDNHQWITWYVYQPQVIALSDHPDAAWEEGLMEGVRSYDDTMITAAYCALRADVYDVIHSIEGDGDDD